jgi:hypothetical protein
MRNSVHHLDFIYPDAETSDIGLDLQWNSKLGFGGGIRVSGGIEIQRFLGLGENSVCREFILERLGRTWGKIHTTDKHRN